MCTKNNRPDQIVRYRKSDSPVPITAYKALTFTKNKKGVRSSLHSAFRWKKGWNLATGVVMAYDSVAKMAVPRSEVTAGALHCALTYARAQTWCNGYPDRQVVQVFIRPEDVVAIERGTGEIAAKKVFVERLKPYILPADPAITVTKVK